MEGKKNVGWNDMWDEENGMKKWDEECAAGEIRGSKEEEARYAYVVGQKKTLVKGALTVWHASSAHVAEGAKKKERKTGGKFGIKGMMGRRRFALLTTRERQVFLFVSKRRRPGDFSLSLFLQPCQKRKLLPSEFGDDTAGFREKDPQGKPSVAL